MPDYMETESAARDREGDKSPPATSDLSHVSFSNDYESLPASGTSLHAHIIDLNENTSCIKKLGAIRLQDAVVTTLFKASPDTLRSFLSPTVNSLKAVFGKGDTQLVIWRKGIEVFIGTFEHHKSLKVYGFEHVAGFLIGYDGAWSLKITAGNAYSNPKWPDVWAGKFESYGGIANMSVEAGELEMARRASTLAESILANKYWELKTDVKAT
ncbi:Nn.00g087940.m01.CDS01 [Neocucurbitaria sp. VM-36]